VGFERVLDKLSPRSIIGSPLDRGRVLLYLRRCMMRVRNLLRLPFVLTFVFVLLLMGIAAPRLISAVDHASAELGVSLYLVTGRALL
jgi:hypothetical protein